MIFSKINKICVQNQTKVRPINCKQKAKLFICNIANEAYENSAITYSRLRENQKHKPLSYKKIQKKVTTFREINNFFTISSLFLQLQKNQKRAPHNPLQTQADKQLSAERLSLTRAKQRLKSSALQVTQSVPLHALAFSTNFVGDGDALDNSKICQFCVDKTKPILETRKVRKGRITYRVPIVINPERQQGKAISSLIQNAVHRKKRNSLSQVKTNTFFSGNTTDLSEKKAVNNSFWVSDPLTKRTFLPHLKKKFPFHFSPTSIKYNLAEEFFDSANNNSESVEKKRQLHNFALQNRASLHFRWW